MSNRKHPPSSSSLEEIAFSIEIFSNAAQSFLCTVIVTWHATDVPDPSKTSICCPFSSICKGVFTRFQSSLCGSDLCSESASFPLNISTKTNWLSLRNASKRAFSSSMMDSRAFRLVSVVIFSRLFSSAKQSTSVICTSFTSCSSFEEEEDIATVLAFALRSPSLMVFVFLFSALKLENRRCVRKLPR
ncbi:unnamed protein product [Bathycoccus prasinos]